MLFVAYGCGLQEHRCHGLVTNQMKAASWLQAKIPDRIVNGIHLGIPGVAGANSCHGQCSGELDKISFPFNTS